MAAPEADPNCLNTFRHQLQCGDSQWYQWWEWDWMFGSCKLSQRWNGPTGFCASERTSTRHIHDAFPTMLPTSWLSCRTTNVVDRTILSTAAAVSTTGGELVAQMLATWRHGLCWRHQKIADAVKLEKSRYRTAADLACAMLQNACSMLASPFGSGLHVRIVHFVRTCDSLVSAKIV